jgi:hypothetical protein
VQFERRSQNERLKDSSSLQLYGRLLSVAYLELLLRTLFLPDGDMNFLQQTVKGAMTRPNSIGQVKIVH